MVYLYNVILFLSLPIVALLYLPLFLLKEKHRKNFISRLVAPAPFFERSGDEVIIWLHAVSVGEVLASLPLIDGIRQVAPNAKIYLSVITVTGRAVAQEKAGNSVDSIFYLPFDLYPLMRKIVGNISPDLLVIMETELWPNFIEAAKSSGARVAIVNGRISNKSFPRYRIFRFFFRSLLQKVDLFLMQSSLDAERIKAIGASEGRVKVTKNLKYDLIPPDSPHMKMIRDRVKNIAGGRKIVVLGSTHEGEEAMILESLRDQIGRIFTVVAPRHPERFDRVEDFVKSSGISYVRRSRFDRFPEEGDGVDLMILDTVGELSGVYETADIVIMGGSFVEVGGHNILEPAIFKKPVITGKYYSNFKQAVEELARENGIVVAGDTRDLQCRVKQLLDDELFARSVGEAAYTLVKGYRGLGLRVAEELLEEMR